MSLTLDVAEQEVQAAINAGGSLLPTDLPAPPVYAKVNPADAPVLTLAISSDSMPLTDVRNLVETRLAQKISQIAGVGLVTLSGGQRPAVRIQADTRQLASLGLSLDQVRTAISNANANAAKGSFDGPTRSYSINANDQLLTVNDYKDLIIAYKDGGPVHLRDVADIVESAENVKLGAWENTRPAIVLNVQRQPGANVIATVDAIKARLPDLQASLPASIKMDLLTDRTLGIRASVRDVELELLVAIALVVLVIFLFLHSVRATVIASLAVPISLVGTFGAMYLLGYSLNNLTLMALTIATGFVVDDAIVMIENIARYIEAGEKPLPAALKRRCSDRIHHHLADGVAHRSADPAAVHGRCGRSAVPRIRGDLGDHHRDFGGGVPDTHRFSIGVVAEARAPRAHGRHRSQLAARLRSHHRAL